jgi:hypothetical protein
MKDQGDLLERWPRLSYWVVKFNDKIWNWVRYAFAALFVLFAATVYWYPLSWYVQSSLCVLAATVLVCLPYERKNKNREIANLNDELAAQQREH